MWGDVRTRTCYQFRSKGLNEDKSLWCWRQVTLFADLSGCVSRDGGRRRGSKTGSYWRLWACVNAGRMVGPWTLDEGYLSARIAGECFSNREHFGLLYDLPKATSRVTCTDVRTTRAMNRHMSLYSKMTRWDTAIYVIISFIYVYNKTLNC